MWPKVLTQLLELTPHLTRLLPIADRYLASRATQDAATGEMLERVANNVRTDVGKVARAHMELAARLDQFAAHVDEIGAGVKLIGTEAARARTAAELAQNRAAEVEAQMRSLRLWLKVGLVLICCLLLLIVVLLLREHGAAA